jgi:hypothetical protein|nr:MAG TPA: hypothetical protein [Caudoviricetes sp.]
MPNYRFYPTLLDKFQTFLDTTAEDYFYQDEDGKWHKNYSETEDAFHYSQEEVDALLKQELLDAINRVPHEPSEPASKGTALNEIVDCIIHNKKSDNKNILIKSLKGVDVKREFGCTDEVGKPIFYDYWFEHIKVPCIFAEIDGFSFYFDKDFCKSIAEYFKGSLSQVFTSATIDTEFGEVELYGYIDELRENKVFDLKTTSRYEFGKYSKYWQRHIYPYTLIESGACTEINSFEFTAYVLKGGTSRTPLITGVQYAEVYQYNHEQSKMLLKNICERFCQFLEDNRELITNKKIFNEE